MGTAFDDRNEALLDEVCQRYPEATSLEMETFHLLDLARCSKGTVRASAAAIGLAQRRSNAFIDADDVSRLEKLGGISLLQTLAAAKLVEGGDSNDDCFDGVETVWGK